MLEWIGIQETVILAIELNRNDSLRIVFVRLRLPDVIRDTYLLFTIFAESILRSKNVSQLVTKFFPIYLTQSSLQVSKFPSTLPIQRHLNPLHTSVFTS